MTQLGQLKWYVLGYGSSCRGITVVQAWFDHAVRGGLMQCETVLFRYPVAG